MTYWQSKCSYCFLRDAGLFLGKYQTISMFWLYRSKAFAMRAYFQIHYLWKFFCWWETVDWGHARRLREDFSLRKSSLFIDTIHEILQLLTKLWNLQSEKPTIIFDSSEIFHQWKNFDWELDCRIVVGSSGETFFDFWEKYFVHFLCWIYHKKFSWKNLHWRQCCSGKFWQERIVGSNVDGAL